MNKKIIIISSIVIIVGVGSYFGYQWYKKRRENKNVGNDVGSESSSTPTPISTPASSGTMSVSTSAPVIATKNYSFPTNWTTTEGNAFRQWVNKNYPDWAKQNDLELSGTLNAYVDRAYMKYGKAYQDALKQIKSTPQAARFNQGEKVELNKNVILTPYRVLNDKYVKTGADRVSFSKGDDFVIKSPIQYTNNIAWFWVQSDNLLGTSDYFGVYQDDLQLRSSWF